MIPGPCGSLDISSAEGSATLIMEKQPSPSPSSLSVGVGDYDLIDELFLRTEFECSSASLLQPGPSVPSSSSPDSGVFSQAVFETRGTDDSKINGESSALFSVAPSRKSAGIVPTNTGVQTEASPPAGWLQLPSTSPATTLQDRLKRALDIIQARQGEGEVLVQIWVPTRIGDQLVLTTTGQPCSVDISCERIRQYRMVSVTFKFSADENSGQPLGLPGRVFVGRLPEWTPDVRYFSTDEYPRVGYAQYYDIRGSVGLPIFDKNDRACLGVVEVVMLARKVNYSHEIENICDALQAVDLRSTGVQLVPRSKIGISSYEVVLQEINGVLRAVCDTHRLPLAQTWMPCIQQAKRGSRHSDEKYELCTSTVDSACYVRDPGLQDFHLACSEHHLLRGEGVAGGAFVSGQSCFCPDITVLSKIRYPLAHHAKLFGLRAAVAIRLRSSRSGNMDFVLEFFLPPDCIDSEDQERVLQSMSSTLEQVPNTLHTVPAQEIEDDKSFSVPDHQTADIANHRCTAAVLQAPASASPELPQHRSEGFSVTKGWHVPDVAQGGGIKDEFYEINGDNGAQGMLCSAHPPSFMNYETAGEKRRSKMEKNISLQDLRKHFAGSLKDAAKNLGVCPTTLKRICRQHGIDRWPSRKIKKVGHSLKKLQLVIDSVHGPQGAVQLSSMYEDFANTEWSDKDNQTNISFSASPRNEHLESSSGRGFTLRTSESNSRSSSSCSRSSTSSLSRSSQPMTLYGSAPQLSVKQEASAEDNSSEILAKCRSPRELQASSCNGNLPQTQFQSQRTVSEIPGNPSAASQKDRLESIKAKAIYGEEKIIFRLQTAWTFQKLKDEIIRRFQIIDQCSVDLKYLDDESEWVLLTCDADLEECIDVYRSSYAQTIRISVHPSAAVPPARIGFF